MKSVKVLLLSLLFCQVIWGQNNFSYYDDVYYEIWLKAFKDSNGDNVGDIKGVIEVLDYLNDGDPSTDTDLGVTGIKIAPFFESGIKTADPNANMHCYDAKDFYAVNSLFGDSVDVKLLIDEAHKRGIKVLFDFVPNHTSDEHPWFIASGKGTGYNNWYVWSDNPSHEWGQPWGGGEWTDVWKLDPVSKRYYYSAFLFEGMPDLNFNEPEVREEIKNVARYWMDFGFDGFRVDAARYLIEEGPGKAADTKESHKYFKELKKVVNEFGNDKIMIAEAWTNAGGLIPYYGENFNEFDMPFDFSFGGAAAESIRRNKAENLQGLLEYQLENYPEGAVTATMTSNHDAMQSRPYSLFKGDLRKHVFIEGMNILLGGLPFIYYGNEIALEGELRGGAHQDYQLRLHFNWDEQKKQLQDENSVLSWFKHFIKARLDYTTLKRGSKEIIEVNDEAVMAVKRVYENEVVFVVCNFADTVKTVTLNAEGNFNFVIGEGNIEQNNSKITFEMPPYTTAVLSNNVKDNIAGFPKNLTGGAKGVVYKGFQYNTMFVRGTFNNWDGSLEMKLDDKGNWVKDVELTKGKYQFKFEVEGKPTWDINFGDADKNGLLDFDGEPMEFTAESDGVYSFIFNFEDLTYVVQKK